MKQLVTRLFLGRLAGSERGRAHLLSLAIDAEEGDEGGVFDRLAASVEDPKLASLVRRHRDDEFRHAGMYRDRLVRLGLSLQPVPDQLKLIRRLAEHAGGWDAPIETAEQIVRTYALLFAVEQRGVEQFPLHASAWAPIDPKTAQTYLEVTADERRHLRYCQAIGRHYARSDQRWNAEVATANKIETRCFNQIGAANAAYAMRTGLLTARSTHVRQLTPAQMEG